jgi:hypothetical protein
MWCAVQCRQAGQVRIRSTAGRTHNFFGAIDVDIEGELAQLRPPGYRPLRERDTLF